MAPTITKNVTKTQQDESITFEWTVVDRVYEYRATTFTKRQLRPHETTWNPRVGEVAQYAFNRERLENERDALIFIARNTTIPVPRFIKWSDDNGVASLTMEKLDGRLMSWLMEDVLDVKLTTEEKATLQRNVNLFIENIVLPQLQKLRSSTMGQLGRVLFSHPEVSQADSRFAKAPPAIQAAIECYQYSHNDLATHNIVIKPDSLDVLCLIDWEYSGFFPPGFEVPFWRCQHPKWNAKGEWLDQNGVPLDFESRRAMLRAPGKPRSCPSAALTAKVPIVNKGPKRGLPIAHLFAYMLGAFLSWIKTHVNRALLFLLKETKLISTEPGETHGMWRSLMERQTLM